MMKPAEITISETEILEALQSAAVESERPSNALTTYELSVALGISDCMATRRVRAAVRAGKLECVMVRMAGIDGVVRPRPAYKPTAKPLPPKKKARR